MYCPAAFREDRAEVLHAAIRAYPLATLVTHGAAGLTANLIPFTLVAPPSGPVLLRAHMARTNPQVEELRAGADALVIFQGPQAYVTPAWYPAKREHGKVVPTWNYIAVQARGRASVTDDAAWLRAQIDQLTDEQERGRAVPWAVDDAPAGFIAGQLRGISGIEIPVERLEGKWKASQNQPQAARSAVAEGLREGETPSLSMADIVAAAT
ncbi:FMN-binding negative transcriptional regulator [Novosphingobium lindaniclasticum]